MSGNSKFVDAALAVFQELGVESMSTRDLVRAAQERKLVDNGKWTYHNMSRKVRESELFDTTGRGRIRLLPVEDRPGDTDPILVNPGPTLGTAVAAEASIVVTQTEVKSSTNNEEPTEFERENFETPT